MGKLKTQPNTGQAEKGHAGCWENLGKVRGAARFSARLAYADARFAKCFSFLPSLEGLQGVQPPGFPDNEADESQSCMRMPS